MKKNGFNVDDFNSEFLKIANNLKQLRNSPQGITPELIDGVKKEVSNIKNADMHEPMKQRLQKLLEHKKMDKALEKEYLNDTAKVLEDLEKFEKTPSSFKDKIPTDAPSHNDRRNTLKGLELNDFNKEDLEKDIEEDLLNKLKHKHKQHEEIPELEKFVLASSKTADKHSAMKARIQRMMDHKKMDAALRPYYLQDTDLVLKDLQDFESRENPTSSYEHLDQEGAEKLMEERRLKKELEKAKKSTAADKAYDVSGETAKDIVDSAHPGNMKTELTMKPENDGDLVETEFERQEKDMEAVNKKPTGSYASLLILEDRLKKAGLNSYAEKVNNIIKSFVPAKIVIAYKTKKLNSTLKSKGYNKFADESNMTYIGNEAHPWEEMQGGNEDIVHDEELHNKMPLVPLVEPEQQKTEKQHTLPNANVLNFQKSYNALVPDHVKLQEDGLWGPKTDSAYKAVGGLSKQKIMDYANKLKNMSAENNTKPSAVKPEGAGYKNVNSPLVAPHAPDNSQTGGYEMPSLKPKV